MTGLQPSHIISLALITISLVVAISFGITTAISVANTYGLLEEITNVDNFLEEIVFSFDIGSVLLALSVVLVSVLFVLYTRG